MPPRTSGYSGTPLVKKLGLRPEMRCLVMAAPRHFDTLLAGADGVAFVHTDAIDDPPGRFDAVHIFCADTRTLQANARPAIDALAQGGMLWVSWPKKSSKLFVDLTEDGVRDVVLPTGWVDVKVCAVDADWSALKFLKRRAR